MDRRQLKCGTSINKIYQQENEQPRDEPTVAILRTCQAVHLEAANLLYSRKFFVHDPRRPMSLCWDWLKRIGPLNRSNLRSLSLSCSSEYPPGIVNRKYHREYSGKIGKLLVESAQLQRLTIPYRLDTTGIRISHPPTVESESKHWTLEACKVAELLYDDFRPLISRAITNGRPLEDISKILTPCNESFLFYTTERGKELQECTQEQANEAKAAMAEHMMCLLKRNVLYRRKGSRNLP